MLLRLSSLAVVYVVYVVFVAAVSAAAPSPADKPFVVRALVGSQSVVEAGKLATEKGGEKVKPLAQKLVADHGQFHASLLKLAEQRDIHPPQSRTERQRRTMGRLSNLKGSSFDRAFVDAMIHEHNLAIALFKRQVEYGKDEEVTKLAAGHLPTLEAHLKSSRELSKRLAAAATTTSRPAK